MKYPLTSIENEDDGDKLEAMLSQAVGMAIENVRTMAMIVKRLTELGRDVTELPLGITATRRQALINIADKVLLPEAYAAFGGKPSVLKHLVMLPAEKQLALTKGEGIKVWRSHDESDHILVQPDQLSAIQMRQVFAETGGLRDYWGQTQWLVNRNNTTTAPAHEPEISEVRYGKSFIEVTGPMQITLAELLEHVKRLTSKIK